MEGQITFSEYMADFDELSALLSGNTSLIYQRVYEQLQKEKSNGDS